MDSKWVKPILLKKYREITILLVKSKKINLFVKLNLFGNLLSKMNVLF